MSIELHQMAAFDAVVRTGSVTKASLELGITQPAVSRQLQQLQRALGTTLLIRHGQGVRATREGEMLAHYSRKIISLVQEAETALQDQQHLRRGRLAIGAGPTLGVYLLPEALVRFRQRFPGISVFLEIGASHLLRDRLLEGTIEFALTESLLPSPDFESTVFIVDELVAIVPRRHRLSGRKSVGPADLASEPFIVREPTSGTQSLVERALAERGIHITPVVSLSSTEAVKRAVAAGLGVSIVSQMSVGLETAAGNLVALRINRLSLKRPVYLVHRRKTTPTKAEVAFLCLLKHVVRGTLPALGTAARRSRPRPSGRT